MPFLLAVSPGGGSVSWHGAVSLRTDVFSCACDAVLVVAGVLYLIGARRGAGGRVRGPTADPGGGGPSRPAWFGWRQASFLAGLVVLFFALCSGFARFELDDLTVDVVQHVLVMMAAPPLVVLGRPGRVLGALARRTVPRTTRAPGRPARAFRALTGVAAWPLYYGSMPAYFLTGAYAGSVHHLALFDAAQVGFAVVGLAFWSGLVGVDRGGTPRSSVFRFGGVVAGMPVESALGLALALWPRPLVPGETVPATHAAGVLLWALCMLTSGVALAALFVQWAVADSRAVDAYRAVARAEAVSPGAGGARSRPSR